MHSRSIAAHYDQFSIQEKVKLDLLPIQTKQILINHPHRARLLRNQRWRASKYEESKT
jgi:hypothetical protein